MKTLAELRKSILQTEITTYQIKYLKRQVVDFDVFLPTKNCNLQRGYVWTLTQKQELIWSVLLKRHIPPISIMSVVDKHNSAKDVIQVIDGKQRLSTIFDFIDDKFGLIIDGETYLFSQLPQEYQMAITYYSIDVCKATEEWDIPFTDQQKEDWFNTINYAGTAHKN